MRLFAGIGAYASALQCRSARRLARKDFRVAIFVGLPFRRRRFRDQPVDFRDPLIQQIKTVKQPSMIGIMSVASVHNRFTATGA